MKKKLVLSVVGVAVVSGLGVLMYSKRKKPVDNYEDEVVDEIEEGTTEEEVCVPEGEEVVDKVDFDDDDEVGEETTKSTEYDNVIRHQIDEKIKKITDIIIDIDDDIKRDELMNGRYYICTSLSQEIISLEEILIKTNVLLEEAETIKANEEVDRKEREEKAAVEILEVTKSINDKMVKISRIKNYNDEHLDLLDQWNARMVYINSQKISNTKKLKTLEIFDEKLKRVLEDEKL